jgi:hypothetical protein
MREYGKVFCALWSSTDFRSLEEDGRSLVLYLLTCPHTTIAGAFRLPDGYITEDLQWSRERVQEGFVDLQDRGFATRCPVTQWVWINKFLTWNPPENPNQWKAVHKVASQIPKDCLWLKEFRKEFPGELPQESEQTANPSETLSKSVAVVVTVAGSGTVSKSAPEWFGDFRQRYPSRSGDQGWRKALFAANARIAEGHTPEQILDGASRYAQFCTSTGKTGTEFVKQAATFLGPEKHFLEPWDPPPTKAARQLDSNISAGLAFLAGGNS